MADSTIPTVPASADGPAAGPQVPGGGKSFIATWLFALFLGGLGIDRFYLGKPVTGVLKLLTWGGIGIWWLVDVILVLAGKQTDRAGRPLVGYSRHKAKALVLTIAAYAAGSALIFAIGATSPQSTSAAAHTTATTRAPSSVPTASAPETSTPQPNSTPSLAAAATPSETAKPLTAEVKAVTLLKTSTNWYRDRLDQGHRYLAAGDMSSFELWWTLMNLGKFVDNAQSAYGDASNLYPGTTPTQLDDWDTIMDVGGDFVTAMDAWHSGHAESDYAKATAALDHADQTVESLAPGITVPRVHGTVPVPAPVQPTTLAPQAARDAAAATLSKAGQDYSAWFEQGAAMTPSPQQIDWYNAYKITDQVNAMENAFSTADKNFTADDEPSSITAWANAATAIPGDIQQWYFSDTGHGEDPTLTTKVRADFASIAKLADSVKAGN